MTARSAGAGRIVVLPSAVADQIAAGEVVERPASVVKELFENALDAGATTIDVLAEDGGRQRIRVSDDGCGMLRDDAVLALERHATSKIRTAADLVGVHTFGFRGEALPAICSVSHLELETASADGAGTRVVAAGGSLTEVGDVARRRGTTLDVRRLFYNAPARQKFLRSARSEWRSVLEVVSTMALVRRDVRLTLAHDGREALALAPAASLRERVAALWSADYAARFVAVDDVNGAIHVSGLAERPADVGTASRRVHLTVNGRAIRDGGMVRAAEAAYRSTLPAGLRPALFRELVVAADSVDVNVHPAKAEVRFRDRWVVERAVEHAVRRALGTLESAATLGGGAPAVWTRWPSAPSDARPLSPEDESRILTRGESRMVTNDESGMLTDGESRPLTSDETPSDVPSLFQLRSTYLMFEAQSGVVLIDQHSAHERVLYEKFLGQLERGSSPSQRLLFPLTVSLTAAESEALDAHRELFQSLGYELAEFGGQTAIVHSVPAPHPRFDAERCLRDTLAALTGDRPASGAARHQHLAATIACKAAIKAGDALSAPEMRALFVALRDCTLPAHDVHGRSTIVHLSWDELERRFGRR
ncbi:MAG TPA: DNA mismatch repair endonuclease MutL [Gemmatimonadaceae bacterium]|nr:DNA mismatch repair endonuclease MutL [Gemmatimonadaceae bacterium]